MALQVRHARRSFDVWQRDERVEERGEAYVELINFLVPGLLESTDVFADVFSVGTPVFLPCGKTR